MRQLGAPGHEALAWTLAWRAAVRVVCSSTGARLPTSLRASHRQAHQSTVCEHAWETVNTGFKASRERPLENRSMWYLLLLLIRTAYSVVLRIALSLLFGHLAFRPCSCFAVSNCQIDM